MPVSAQTLRLLMDAGVDGAELLAIVESIDNTPKQRSANAERQARFRAKQRAESVTDNVTSNVTESVTPRVHVEDNLQTKDSTGQARKKTAREDEAEFALELSSLLDADRVQALVDVRKKKGGKVNGHAARLLMAKIRDCGLTPIEAADTMVLRNWISIEADWLRRNATSGGASPPGNRKSNAVDAMQQIFEERGWTNNGSDLFRGDNVDDHGVSAERSQQQGAVVDLRAGAYRRG